MRALSGEEHPDAGQRIEGHNVVMQYFAQDEATRLDPKPTVYETLAAGSPLHMVPAIRNILGGFLFSGDDIYKPVRVLSGGERTRLAVARMLLRPSNTLLLDEPTNHLDLDSKEVLLDALIDYGGTLIFVSHDRYFVERLATKIIEVGSGTAIVYPGTYPEFLWHKEHPDQPERDDGRRPGGPQRGTAKSDARAGNGHGPQEAPHTQRQKERPRAETHGNGKRNDRSNPIDRPTPVIAQPTRDEKKRNDAEARRKARADQARRARIEEIESRIAATEAAIRAIEQAMAAPGFYDDRTAAQAIVDRHQALMWEVGDLMGQWEALQTASDLAPVADH
jgi:ATP-binding cassette subfamily F protein 3